MKRIFLAVFIIISVASCVNKKIDNGLNIEEQILEQVEENILIGDEIVDTVEPVVIKEENQDFPATYLLDVDFASQAPDSNWELPYQEACEEAALIQAYYYFTGKELNNALMDQEILLLVDWEQETFGLYSDTNLNEVRKIAEDYFNLEVEISEDVSVDNIKKNLLKGNLILAPTLGRLLDNPNFTGDGPLYHFVVIRGYDRNEFITNDVGTRNGEAYKYKYKVLQEAIHDLPNKEDGSTFRPYDEELESLEKENMMLGGEKRVLVVKGLIE